MNVLRRSVATECSPSRHSTPEHSVKGKSTAAAITALPVPGGRNERWELKMGSRDKYGRMRMKEGEEMNEKECMRTRGGEEQCRVSRWDRWEESEGRVRRENRDRDRVQCSEHSEYRSNSLKSIWTGYLILRVFVSYSAHLF
jgi:hypothetical protein